ncbi:hypothetical protein LINPERPRIM_LOCUS21888 [Linum perenne]
MPASEPHRTSWTVEVIDEANNRRMKNMVVADAWANLRDGEKIVLSWAAGIPSGHTVGFLGQFIGKVARSYKFLPVGYDEWRKVPRNFKNQAWNELIAPKFYIEERDLPAARHYIFMDMGKKWREGRGELIHEKCDKKKNLEWNQVNPPDGIEVTDWVMFLAYRDRKKVKEMAVRNKAIRAKQGLLHHLGSKKINRLKSEMEEELQREVSRGEVWIRYRKRKNGEFANEECAQVGKNIEEIEASGDVPKHPARNDSLGLALNKDEHSGRVRCMGLGYTPSQVFTGMSSNYGRGAYSANPAANPNVVSRADFDKMAGMFMSVFNQIPGLVIPPELAAFAQGHASSTMQQNGGSTPGLEEQQEDYESIV